MSGSTVALQWVYSGSTMGLQWVYNGVTVMNKRRNNEENILSPVTYSPIRRLLPRRGSIVMEKRDEEKTVRAARADDEKTKEGRTKDEG